MCFTMSLQKYMKRGDHDTQIVFQQQTVSLLYSADPTLLDTLCTLLCLHLLVIIYLLVVCFTIILVCTR